MTRSDSTRPSVGAASGLSQLQPGAAAAKIALRRTLLAARRELTPLDLRSAERTVLDRLLDLPEVRLAGCVACYVSIGAEPATGLFLAALRARDTRVLLPVLLADNDLDWAEYRAPHDLAAAGRGLREPTGARLGVDEIGRADVLVLPGLAVGSDGHRMGRGGGSYDRVLARVARLAPQARTVVLLHSGEVDQPVPIEAHDRRVDIAITPEGVHRYR